MFERFNAGARQAVVCAADEARIRGDTVMGSEHLLLGILAADGCGADALGSLGVTLEQARAVLGPGDGVAIPEQIPYTQDAKDAFEASLRSSLDHKDDYIGSEHLALGLVASPGSRATQVLTDLGADATRVTAAVAEHWRTEPGHQKPRRKWFKR